jgi:hypothetical protein
MNDKIILQHHLHKWLGGIKPAWDGIPPKLRMDFINAPRIEDGPTLLNENLKIEDLSVSLVLHHAQLVLKAIVSAGGAPLTQKGSLTRKFTEEMIQAFNWPKYEEKTLKKYCKVINEQDFLPLHFIHILLRSAGIIRKYKKKVIITKSGKEYLEPRSEGKFFAALFKALVNDFNLAYLDRVPIEQVIQPQIGFILYLISKEADEWINPDRLMKLTIIPVETIFGGHLDYPNMIFEARVLRFMKWFGLMEERVLSDEDVYPIIRDYRKTELFNKFISYEV